MVGITEGGRQTADAIRRQAAESFAQHGYEATSLRTIAAAVGIKVGSLYNHISSKEELLLSVMGGTMDELNAAVDSALSEFTEPAERLVRFLECHLKFHAEHAQQVFIGNSELRSLPPEARQEITEKRRAYRLMIEQLIAGVTDTGLASPVNPRLQAFSIVAIGTHVASWYRADGGLSLDEIIRDYTLIILRGLGVANADDVANAYLTIAAA